MQIETPRLLLRQWKEADQAAFARMNQDPLVMRYFPSLQGSAESMALIERQRALIGMRGWGLWAVEEVSSARFIGFVGLAERGELLPCAPCVDIGWRLAAEFWGKGYATEAARAALRFAFEHLALEEIVSFTALPNHPSRRVMARIGMHDTGRDFDHPSVPEGSPLRRHCLYAIDRAAWLAHIAPRSSPAASM